MLFNSYTYLLFFLSVTLIYRAIPTWRAQKCFLLAVGYIFYAAWNPPFVVLLWIATVVDFFLARLLMSESRPLRRKAYFIVSLVLNLSLLGYFKYAPFLLANFNFALGVFGIGQIQVVHSFVLPVGMSFYTFETLSYTFDVYRRRLNASPSLVDYALFVSFFPHLVAGPIVRAADFLPQCAKPHRPSAAQVGWGCSLLVIGLFSKMVVADAMMAPIADAVFKTRNMPTFLDAWSGTLAFSLQIFCDFSGYSLCAIGSALVLGFVLKDNFHFPYSAIGFSDFWRRWHISLSSWLRDYLYIPLGGNRRGELRSYANMFVTMVLGGLWHGASWMFVIWGALHGSYLVIERLLRRLPAAQSPASNSPAVRAGLCGITFLATSIAWVFFRSPNMTVATKTILGMIDFTATMQQPKVISIAQLRTVLVFTLITVGGQYMWRNRTLEELFAALHWLIRALLLSALLFLTMLAFTGEDHAFIYFQF